MSKYKIYALIKKELLLEWRQRYAISGILLHVTAMVFVVYLSLKIINPPTWNAIFWLILLFSSIGAVAKSFISESTGQSIYYYSIAKPSDVIIAKLIYNGLLMTVLTAVCLIVYTTLVGNFAQNIRYYILSLWFGSMGFSAAFTLLSAISAKASNSNGLMPVLSFPLIIPTIMVAIKTSKKAMDGIDVSLITPDLLVLLAINALIVGLAYVLFPFLWRD
jgi:heme exporter protein B